MSGGINDQFIRHISVRKTTMMMNFKFEDHQEARMRYVN